MENCTTGRGHIYFIKSKVGMVNALLLPNFISDFITTIHAFQIRYTAFLNLKGVSGYFSNAAILWCASWIFFGLSVIMPRNSYILSNFIDKAQGVKKQVIYK